MLALVLEPALSNGARSLSCFEFCFLRIEQRRSIAPRGGERARSRRHALGLGWPGGTPHGLGYPPSAYKTGAKNISDSKIPRAIRRTIFWTIFYFLVRRRVSRLNERPDPPAVDPAGRGIDQAAVEAARMIRSHDIANSQVAGQRVWQLADYARFEADWVRAISAGDIAAIRKAVEDTSLPWHEQLADVRATIDTMLGRQAKASLPPPDGLRPPRPRASRAGRRLPAWPSRRIGPPLRLSATKSNPTAPSSSSPARASSSKATNSTNGLRSMRLRLKGINSITKTLADGTKRTYYYAWKGGPPLREAPGTPEFIASYNEAVARKVTPPRGTLLSALQAFQASENFLGLADETRRSYAGLIRRNIEGIRRLSARGADRPPHAWRADGMAGSHRQ